MEIYMKECGNSDYFAKFNQKVNDPKMTFDPTSVEVICVTLPKDHFYPSPTKICRSMWILECHWPLDDLWPQVCWGHMSDSTQGSLCPSPMKIHQSMWTQWPFLKKNNQRSLTPRWPLTPHLLRSHVSLYPRIIVFNSHGNTSMYVDRVINFAKYHLHTTYIHLLCTCIHTYYVQNEWSHSLFLNYVQARQKENQVAGQNRLRI